MSSQSSSFFFLSFSSTPYIHQIILISVRFIFNQWSTFMGQVSLPCNMLESLSLRFNGHFPGEPGLAGVYWSKGWWRWWWLDYWSYTSCKAPVKSSPPTNQHPVFLTGQMPFLLPNQQCQSTEGKISHSMDLLTPSSPGVFQLCLWPLIAPGYLGRGLPCLSSAL